MKAALGVSFWFFGSLTKGVQLWDGLASLSGSCVGPLRRPAQHLTKGASSDAFKNLLSCFENITEALATEHRNIIFFTVLKNPKDLPGKIGCQSPAIEHRFFAFSF